VGSASTCRMISSPTGIFMPANDCLRDIGEGQRLGPDMAPPSTRSPFLSTTAAADRRGAAASEGRQSG